MNVLLLPLATIALIFAQAAATQAPCPEAPDAMACIPGGAFVRGHDTRDKNARPAAEVTVSTFFMDTHEVTNAAYKACVRAKKCEKAGPRYRGYGGDRQPVTGVSWHQAKAYCAAQGKRLPTEAEWEKAARGVKGELYPWGDTRVTCERAVIKNKSGRACGVPKPYSKPDVGQIFEVGKKPAGRYGLYDMIGNAQEWVSDWYSPSYEACGEACQGVDPKGPCAGKSRCKSARGKKVLRGGSWYWPASHATGIHRRSNEPTNRPFHHFGFRCAAPVAQAKAH